MLRRIILSPAPPLSLPASLCLLLTSTSTCLALDQKGIADQLEKNLIPVLEQRCFDCHDNSVAKGDINLEILRDPTDKRFDIRMWDKVREQLRAGTMPPPKKEALEPESKAAILAWIGENEKNLLTAPMHQPGPPRSRRMNREEYSNALRDLLGVKERYSSLFPADGAGGEGFSNHADTLTMSPLLIEKYLTAGGQAIEEVWSRPELKARLLEPVKSDKLPGDVGADIALRPFLRRAFRRPITDADAKPFVDVFRAALKRGGGWDGSLKVMFKAVLVSPKFLFLEDATQETGKPARQLTHEEMATQLSFFLWSSIPDEELLKLAAEKKLQDDQVLAAQVKRMLADAKAEQFIKNFAGQWLRFEEVFNTVDPDRRKFPEFNEKLRQSMHDEVFLFSSEVLRRNGRVLDFIDSDYTYINEPLAKLYDIPEVKGEELRRVKLTDPRRGGLTGMSAILASTSHPQRTSPVLRGKWILEQLLGAPPPPPPPNVGQLPEDDRSFKESTLRQRLEAHRSKPACAGCHVRLDPPGFGLENFNPIGKWRTDENGKPLDVSGEMPGGRKFNGPAELRKLLMEDKSLFVRSLCTKLLGYALGRSVEIYDQPTVVRLEDTLRKADYHSEPLIIAVVQSYPFRWRD